MSALAVSKVISFFLASLVRCRCMCNSERGLAIGRIVTCLMIFSGLFFASIVTFLVISPAVTRPIGFSISEIELTASKCCTVMLASWAHHFAVPEIYEVRVKRTDTELQLLAEPEYELLSKTPLHTISLGAWAAPEGENANRFLYEEYELVPTFALPVGGDTWIRGDRERPPAANGPAFFLPISGCFADVVDDGDRCTISAAGDGIRFVSDDCDVQIAPNATISAFTLGRECFDRNECTYAPDEDLHAPRTFDDPFIRNIPISFVECEPRPPTKSSGKDNPFASSFTPPPTFTIALPELTSTTSTPSPTPPRFPTLPTFPPPSSFPTFMRKRQASDSDGQQTNSCTLFRAFLSDTKACEAYDPEFMETGIFGEDLVWTDRIIDYSLRIEFTDVVYECDT